MYIFQDCSIEWHQSKSKSLISTSDRRFETSATMIAFLSRVIFSRTSSTSSVKINPYFTLQMKKKNKQKHQISL